MYTNDAQVEEFISPINTRVGGYIKEIRMLILFRSFIGPAFWGAVYSYGLYADQIRHTAAIVQHMDVSDPLFISRMNPVVMGL